MQSVPTKNNLLPEGYSRRHTKEMASATTDIFGSMFVCSLVLEARRLHCKPHNDALFARSLPKTASLRQTQRLSFAIFGSVCHFRLGVLRNILRSEKWLDHTAPESLQYCTHSGRYWLEYEQTKKTKQDQRPTPSQPNNISAYVSAVTINIKTAVY